MADSSDMPRPIGNESSSSEEATIIQPGSEVVNHDNEMSVEDIMAVPQDKIIDELTQSLAVISEDDKKRLLPTVIKRLEGLTDTADAPNDLLLKSMEVATTLCEGQKLDSDDLMSVITFVERTMTSKNEKVVEQALECLNKLSFEECHRDAIAERMLPTLTDISADKLQHRNVLAATLKMFNNLTAGNMKRKHLLIETECLENIFEHLLSPDKQIQALVLSVIASLSALNECRTKMMAHQYHKLFPEIYQSDNFAVKQLAVLCLINLSLGSEEIVSEIIQAKVLHEATKFMDEDKHEEDLSLLDGTLIRKILNTDMAYCQVLSLGVLDNLLGRAGKAKDIVGIVEQGGLSVLCNHLKRNDVGLQPLGQALEGITYILQKDGKNLKNYCRQIKENGSLDIVCMLRQHRDQTIYTRAARVAQICNETLEDTRPEDKQAKIEMMLEKKKRIDVIRRKFKAKRSCARNLIDICKEVSVNHDAPRARRLNILLSRVLQSLMQKVMEADPRFVGILSGVGSNFDKTKIRPADEEDFVYILTHPVFKSIHVWDANENEKSYLLSVLARNDYKDIFDFDGNSLSSDKVYRVFAALIADALPKVELPPGLSYGGVCYPGCSGVRENPPCVTLLFTWQGRGVTVDVTPCFSIPEEKALAIIETLPDHIQNVLGSISNGSRHFRKLYEFFHFVPGTGGNTWRLSTPCLEALLLGKIPSRSSVKSAIIFSKYINSSIFTLEAMDVEDTFQPELEKLRNQCIEAESDDDRKQKFCSFWNDDGFCVDPEKCVLYLKALAEFQHSSGSNICKEETVEWCLEKLTSTPWILKHGLHPTIQKMCVEKPKSLISSSSCIYKYKILERYFQGKIPLDKLSFTPCQEVLEEYLSGLDSSSKTFRHAILGYTLPVRSVSTYVIDGKIPGLKVAQIKAIHREIVSTVVDGTNGRTRVPHIMEWLMRNWFYISVASVASLSALLVYFTGQRNST